MKTEIALTDKGKAVAHDDYKPKIPVVAPFEATTNYYHAKASQAAWKEHAKQWTNAKMIPPMIPIKFPGKN